VTHWHGQLDRNSLSHSILHGSGVALFVLRERRAPSVFASAKGLTFAMSGDRIRSIVTGQPIAAAVGDRPQPGRGARDDRGAGHWHADPSSTEEALLEALTTGI